ncbi:hypothetical protein WJX72_005994 [[Myrmecia] bisecta]|uniref:Protein CLP1 homolog n=1 Tax=[Myrmecia] bisecta TaxID=41462 RepID=A0AAW1QAS5_9CHLO
MAEAEGCSRSYSLKAEHELRVEVTDGRHVYISLREGQAEVFGSELILGEKLEMRSQKFAVYTWHGCRIELSTDAGALEDVTDVVYEADETPMVAYSGVHGVLEERRHSANQASGQGPRTIVVGPVDAGKSTLCRILLNYGVRSGWAPTMVDLDIGQGSITCPGTIGATPIEAQVDIEEGLPVEVPLVYFYGHASPAENPEMYKFLVDRLASLLDKRAQSNAAVRAAGMVINTMGWIDGLGYTLLLHSIEALKADVVLVVGQDKLWSQLDKHYRTNKDIQVVKLTKSGGVVARPPALRKQARVNRVKEYFYGVRGDLSPQSQTVNMSELRVYRAGGGPRAPSSALPIGSEPVADPLRLAPININSDLLHSVLAVSHATEPEQLLSVNVAGFLFVTTVDVDRGTLTYLAPCPGPLPGKLLLAGSLKVFFE